MRGPDKIVLHSSATRAEQDIRAADIHRWHVVERGWRAIAYHLVVCRDGAIEPGRPLDETADIGWQTVQGAHARGHNRGSIGICLVGGLGADGRPEDNFTPEQKAALGDALRFLKRCFPKARVLGHRDLPGARTACPSFEVAALLASCDPPIANP